MTDKKLNIAAWSFEGHTITFQFDEKNVMVNATEMAKVYQKLPKDFLRNRDVKLFVKACLNKENSPYLNTKTIEDLVVSSQKSGTWMHRILALKFAAWLDPEFEIWVYRTIDNILFGYARKMKKNLKSKVSKKQQLEELEASLAEIAPDLWKQRQAIISEINEVNTIIKRVNKEEMSVIAQELENA